MQHIILGNLLRAARNNPAAWRCAIWQPRLSPDGSFNVLPNGNFEYQVVGTAYAVMGAALSVLEYEPTGGDYASEFKLTLIPEPLTGQPLTFPPMMTPMILHMDWTRGAMTRPPIS